jgi:tetratricopeptide (TPR) repeat protein
MNSSIRFAAIIFFSLLSSLSSAGEVDSLLTLLKKSKQDTNRIILLAELTAKLRSNNLDSARMFANQCMELSKKLDYKPGIAEAYLSLCIVERTKGDYPAALELGEKARALFGELGNESKLGAAYTALGITYRSQGNYPKAIEYHKNGIALYEKVGDKEYLPGAYNSIGVVYRHIGDFSKSLDYYFKALMINEEINDQRGLANTYTNIGNIYGSNNDMKKALEYHTKSLEIAKAINFKRGISISLTNIGLVYNEWGDYDKALEYSLQTLEYLDKKGGKRDVANTYANIGELYGSKREFKKAFYYAQKALDIRTEIGDKWGVIRSMIVMGHIHMLKGEAKEAIEYQEDALRIAKEIGALQEIGDISRDLAEAYEKQGEYQRSLEFFKQYKLYNDSLLHTGSADKLNQLQAQYDADKREKEIELLKKDNELQEMENNKQEMENKKNRMLLYFSGGGALLLLGLSMVVFRAYRQKRKANVILEEQNEKISVQKSIIEQKNKDITDSITYAKRIQEAILIPADHLEEMFPHHFLLYQPRDIISGDFYWAHRTASGKLVWAVADCTGHGVPGALMSMIGVSLLNEIVAQKYIEEPAEILNELRKGVLNALKQKGETSEHVKDGMDMALCVFDPATRVLEFAGAQNPLYMVRAGAGGPELVEVKSDKQAVGYSYTAFRPFTNHRIQAGPGDIIYLFTDGFADQFGGEKGKKFTYKKLKELLISLNSLPMKEQGGILSETLAQWKTGYEQVDDILVMGVKA